MGEGDIVSGEWRDVERRGDGVEGVSANANRDQYTATQETLRDAMPCQASTMASTASMPSPHGANAV